VIVSHWIGFLPGALKILPTGLFDNYSPLPWREGIKGRGKQKAVNIKDTFSAPTLALPRRGGGEVRVVGQPPKEDFKGLVTRDSSLVTFL
jgi:hypothetical protein